jgi:hypothetical protein
VLKQGRKTRAFQPEQQTKTTKNHSCTKNTLKKSIKFNNLMKEEAGNGTYQTISVSLNLQRQISHSQTTTAYPARYN